MTGPFGSALHSHEYVSDGVAVVPTEAVSDGRLDFTKFPYVTPSKAQALKRHKLRKGDLIFARRGAQACGKSALVRDEANGAIAGTGVIVARVLNQERLDPEYFAYAAGSPDSVAWLKHHAIGATMPNLNSSVIASLRIPLPDLYEQKKVVEVLKSIDDKIELNRRMNQTLETIARALFKSWFVDFDPVRAKAEGRDTGLPEHLADLFPDRFVDSELGEIPEGWTEGALEDLAVLNPESWSKKAHPCDVDYVDLSNTKNGVVEQTQEFEWDSAPSRARRVLRKNDTIMGTVRPGNRSYAFIASDGLTGSTGFAVLRPKEVFNRYFIYSVAVSEANIERLAHLADGAAYPAVRPEAVSSTECVIPNRNVLKAFDDLVDPLRVACASNEQSSGTLSGLREALLPKLLSGKLSAMEAA